MNSYCYGQSLTRLELFLARNIRHGATVPAFPGVATFGAAAHTPSR
jgi:hypothetical protein